MKKFDNNIQQLKYGVLKALIKNAYDNDLENIYIDIPKMISKGPKAELRCCIYKERAILQERIKIALSGRNNPNTIEVIDIACEECPMGGLYVTPVCRGCIGHKCQDVCPNGAVAIIDRKAIIDNSKCIECGKCIAACPYHAIIHQIRPCVRACRVDAINVSEDKAVIDYEKCISCGECVYQCPFGAITDVSFITDIINILKGSDSGRNYKVFAVVAPAIASQFSVATIGQAITGIKQLGFYDVVEAAAGADMALHHEVLEWAEKSKLITSCCYAFVDYVKKNFPQLQEYISSSPSPMIITAQLLKKQYPDCKVIFIGPCTAKKSEFKFANPDNAIDSVMSFEELRAFLDARNIDLQTLSETPVNNASFYGRIFAKSGGISQGVKSLAASCGIEGVEPVAMDGIEDCRMNLLRLKANKSPYNFFEGMACCGGCVNGALSLNHNSKSAAAVEKFAGLSSHQDVEKAIGDFENYLKNQKNKF